MEVATINAIIGEFLFTPYSKCLCVVNKYDWEEIRKKISIIDTTCVINTNVIYRENNDHNWFMIKLNYTTDKEHYLGFMSQSIFLFISHDCPAEVKDFVRTLYGS